MNIPADYILGFGLILARMTGFLLIVPVLSHRAVSARIKVMITIILSVFAMSLPKTGAASQLHHEANAMFMLSLMVEIGVGVMLALPARLMYEAVETYSEVTASSIGLANSFTMSLEIEQQLNILSNYFRLCAITLIVIADLHLVLIAQVLRSFEVPGALFAIAAEPTLTRVAGYVANTFWTGVKMSAPFVIAALVINISAGVINRMIQQIPVYFVSMPVLLAVGTLVLQLSAPLALVTLVIAVREHGIF